MDTLFNIPFSRTKRLVVFGCTIGKQLNRQNTAQIEAREMYKQGVTKLSETEFIVTGISAFDKEVNGCLRHKKHCMISFTKIDDKTIYDLFLDKDQTIRLHQQLDKILYGNEND